MLKISHYFPSQFWRNGSDQIPTTSLMGQTIRGPSAGMERSDIPVIGRKSRIDPKGRSENHLEGVYFAWQDQGFVREGHQTPYADPFASRGSLNLYISKSRCRLRFRLRLRRCLAEKITELQR